MIQQSQDGTQGAGSHVGSHFSTSDDMVHAPHGRGEHLGLEIIILKDLYDLGDQFQPVMTGIVDLPMNGET